MPRAVRRSRARRAGDDRDPVLLPSVRIRRTRSRCTRTRRSRQRPESRRIDVRFATDSDIPEMAGLQATASRSRFDSHMPHSDETWRWLIEREGTHQLRLRRAGDEFVGCARDDADRQRRADDRRRDGASDAEAIAALVATARRADGAARGRRVELRPGVPGLARTARTAPARRLVLRADPRRRRAVRGSCDRSWSADSGNPSSRPPTSSSSCRSGSRSSRSRSRTVTSVRSRPAGRVRSSCRRAAPGLPPDVLPHLVRLRRRRA